MAPLPTEVESAVSAVRLDARDESSSLLVGRSASLLVARDTTTADKGSGSIDPNNINMKGIQALFAIIGLGMVLGSIWFFFWAKNGGFRWRKTDWDDYKSTVLRRKGPDGKTLSNASASTKLGGGSIVGSQYRDDDGTMTWEGSSVSGATVMSEKKAAKAAKKKVSKEKKEKSRGKNRRKSERWEGEGDEDVRAYRSEKPARVGGINRVPEGEHSEYTGSSYVSSETASSAPTYTEKPRRTSTSSPHKRHSSSASNALPRRDYSFTAGTEDTVSNDGRRAHRAQRRSTRQTSPRKPAAAASTRRSQRYTEPIDFETEYTGSQYSAGNSETGTRSYHHPIPGLSTAGGSNHGAGTKKDKRASGGYRRGGGRGRRDSLSESE